MSNWQEARTRGILATVLAALFWSTAGLFIKLLSQDAFTILCYRSTYVALVFLLVYRREVFQFNWRTGLNALFYALLLISFVTSTKLTTAANSIFLQYTGVAYILLLEPLLTRESFQRVNILTALVCFLGMGLFFSEGLQGDDGWGIPIAAFSGLMFAGFFLGQRLNVARYHVAAIFWGNVAVALVGFPSFLASAPPSLTEHGMLLFLGVVQMGLGFILFTYGIRRISATEASLISMLEPLFNPIWVIIGYGELPALQAWLGGGIIISALVVRLLILRRIRTRLTT
jgi:drug/metabolite transporter (DMT)-like permease